MLGEVYSTRVRIGGGWFVTILYRTRAIIRLRAARVCSNDRHSVRSARLKAQVSITCWPWVLMIFTCWPFASIVALPFRAGMVTKDDAVINGTPLSEP